MALLREQGPLPILSCHELTPCRLVTPLEKPTALFIWGSKDGETGDDVLCIAGVRPSAMERNGQQEKSPGLRQSLGQRQLGRPCAGASPPAPGNL